MVGNHNGGMLKPIQCNGWTALTDWGVIQVQGADAATFLHQQLSQDFLLVKPLTARLAAYCSPKGRMLASLIAVPLDSDHWGLVLPLALVEGTLKRLSLFVLRAKVQLSHDPQAWQVWGALGDAAESVWGASDAPLPTWQCAVMKTPWPTGAVGLALPAAPDCARALVLSHPLSPDAPPCPMSHPQAWAWAEVASAIPHVDAVGREAFVPQMLNFESIGGVNFKKGCYPGQEVVARSQFRGAIKRRTVRASAHVPLPPGTPIYLSGDAREPVGVVVNSSAIPEEPTEHLALVCVQTDALQAPALCVGDAKGPELHLQGLPYSLLEDI